MYPRLRINLAHLRRNVQTLSRLCAQHGIRMTGVTKVFRGDPVIADILVQGAFRCWGIPASPICAAWRGFPPKNG